jgi:hypothetical protein
MPGPVFLCGILQGSDFRTYPQAFLPVLQAFSPELHLQENRQTTLRKSRLPLQTRYIPVPGFDNKPVEGVTQ